MLLLMFRMPFGLSRSAAWTTRFVRLAVSPLMSMRPPAATVAAWVLKSMPAASIWAIGWPTEAPPTSVSGSTTKVPVPMAPASAMTSVPSSTRVLR